MKIGIIADDLTSAADGAAPFGARGFDCEINRGDFRPSNIRVASIDVNSRSSVEEVAANNVAAITHKLRDCHILYKTIDSTLRGHARAEILAAYQASGRHRLVIAPAFPEAGRVTAEGVQYVNGQPVSETSYGEDPVHPAWTSRVVDLLDPSIGKYEIIPQSADGAQIIRAIGGAQALVLDADCQNALNLQVSRIPDPEDVLWVGSPGLAQALAALYPQESTKTPLLPQATRILVVAGSANHVSHEQCSTLQAAGVPIVRNAQQIPEMAEIVCLAAPLERTGDPKTVLRDLSHDASKAIQNGGFDGLIATGGDTMAAILKGLAIQRFSLLGVLEPGFPLGSALREENQAPLLLGLKAGGFGNPATLLNAASSLLSKQNTKRKAMA